MAVRILFLFPLSLILFNCENPIKNTKEKVIVEKGTEVITASDENLPKEGNKSIEFDTSESTEYKTPKKILEETKNHVLQDCIGFWVGYFEKDSKKTYDPKKDIILDEYGWLRENKINISIDTIIGNKVLGHSVVAGNNRPFKGTIKIDSLPYYTYKFDVKEPGDDKYDGRFIFDVINNELIGKWKAYKKIDIKKRKYKLTRKTVEYDTSQLLVRRKRYVDWKKERKETLDEGPEGQDEEWIRTIYSTSTQNIYHVNASSKLLSKEIVENLTKGDLKIIRNTIYARHGYSFKNRQLRVFFDAQPWYIPVHTDIKKELTDIEKKNIRLLLKYEKNAVEYYDYFGRG